MKILFAILFCLPVMLSAQSLSLKEAEAYAIQLVHKKILSEKGKTLLLKHLQDEGDSITKYNILQFCSSAFHVSQWHRASKNSTIEDKIIDKEPLLRDAWTMHSFFGSSSIPIKTDIIHPARSSIGFTRNRTLEDFRQIDLIDEKIYQDCKKALLDSSVHDEAELIQLMAVRSYYYDSYADFLKQQHQLIEQLTNKGILTSQAKDELIKSYKPFELKSVADILAHSDRYTFVDLSSVEPNPKIIYPIIFKAVKKLLPSFQYDNLSVNIVETKDFSLMRQDIKLSFTVDGQLYSHLFFHDYYNPVPDSFDIETPPDRVDEDFHKGINKWLTDKESEFRLYTVTIPDRKGELYGKSKLGLVLLKKGEAEEITTDPYALSRESFDNRLSSRGIEKFIQELNNNEFFNHLSAEEMSAAKEKIASAEINTLEDVLVRFPKTVVVFDWETGNLENPYEELTRALAAASRGAFVVSNITDEFKKGWNKAKKVKYGFTLNGKRYEAMLRFDDDWLAPEFLDMLMAALKEQKINGNFYYCVDNGQESGYIFLNNEQFKFIKTNYPDLLK